MFEVERSTFDVHLFSPAPATLQSTDYFDCFFYQPSTVNHPFPWPLLQSTDFADLREFETLKCQSKANNF